ncbi:hypothetical protein M8A54_000366 [Salmonella enterica]|nr:hypothetical protein [Salmonella enterica]
MKDIKQFWLAAKKTAQKLHGIVAGTIWFDNDDPDEIDALTTMAIKKAGFKRSDFFKPVRVDHLVVDDMPLEGFFDTEFCERYKLAEDGKSWLLPAEKQESTDNADVQTGDGDAGITGSVITENTAGTNGDTTIEDNPVPPVDAGPEGLGYNVNGEPMADVMKKMDWPVVEMSLPMRWMAQMGKTSKALHVGPEEYGRMMAMTMPQDDDEQPLLNNINLLLASDLAPDIEQLDLYHLHRLVMAVEKVTSEDKRTGLHLLCRFVRAWLDTEYINQGLLVKEWCEGRRVSRVENAPAPEPKNAEPLKPEQKERPRRSEKPTHRTLNYEIACALHDGELDYHNLRPLMDFAKRTIADDQDDWKRWSAAIGITADILSYDRQTILDMVRNAPAVVRDGGPELRREYIENYLVAYGHRDPDWANPSTVKTVTEHEDVLNGIRQAGQRLREIESGIAVSEDVQTGTETLADKPAETESVEQATAEHHQDTQPLDVKTPVESDEALREKVGKQLAAGRGEYVEGLSDPNDPKWIHENGARTSSNEGEKAEAQQDNPAQQKDVVRVSDGVFDVSGLFPATSNSVGKTEMPSTNDDRSHELHEVKDVITDTGTALLLREIARLQERNNQLLEASIAQQSREERRREKLMDALVFAVTRWAYTMTEDESDES